MDFNTITEKDEKAALIKFKEHGAGINMGKYAGRINGADAASYAELMDSSLYSERAIKTKMLEIARTINTNCNDEFLGDLSTAFTVKTPLGKRIKFTYLECYTFLRAILRERRESAEYKKKLAKLREAKKFIEENKSTEDKMKEAEELRANLEKELGEDVSELLAED